MSFQIYTGNWLAKCWFEIGQNVVILCSCLAGYENQISIFDTILWHKNDTFVKLKEIWAEQT